MFTKAKLLILVWGLLLLPALYFGIELPFYLNIKGANALLYHPQREPRPLKWDENYQIDFGFETVEYEAWDAQLRLQVAQYLERYQPYIHTLELGYTRGKHRLALGTNAIGIGENYWQSSLLVYPRKNEFLLENARLNAVSYTYRQENLSLKAALGGNRLSQAMGLLALGYQGLQLDFRGTASDAHWYNPSLISHLGYSHQAPKFSFSTDLMHKYVFDFSDRPSRNECAFAAQTSYLLAPECSVSLAAVHEHREYAPFDAQEYHLAINKAWNKMTVSPWLAYRSTDECLQGKLLTTYEFYPEARLGFAYGLGKPQNSDIYHEFILQADLAFGF